MGKQAMGNIAYNQASIFFGLLIAGFSSFKTFHDVFKIWKEALNENTSKSDH